jgi:ribosome-binding factor A
MSSRRVQKAAEAIREVVSMAILADLRDPRIADVTVTYVELSADMRHAKVHVSVMGDEKKQDLCIHGLQHSAGFLQRKIGQRIDTRYTPKIEFMLDMGVKRSIEITQILDEVLPAEQTALTASDDPAEADDTERTEPDHD